MQVFNSELLLNFVIQRTLDSSSTYAVFLVNNVFQNFTADNFVAKKNILKGNLLKVAHTCIYAFA